MTTRHIELRTSIIRHMTVTNNIKLFMSIVIGNEARMELLSFVEPQLAKLVANPVHPRLDDFPKGTVALPENPLTTDGAASFDDLWGMVEGYLAYLDLLAQVYYPDYKMTYDLPTTRVSALRARQLMHWNLTHRIASVQILDVILEENMDNSWALPYLREVVYQTKLNNEQRRLFIVASKKGKTLDIIPQGSELGLPSNWINYSAVDLREAVNKELKYLVEFAVLWDTYYLG